MKNSVENDKSEKSGMKHKKEWIKPDIYIYPVSETMTGPPDQFNDGSCNS